MQRYLVPNFTHSTFYFLLIYRRHLKQLDEKETWQAALGELEVVLSKANFTTWFKDTFVYYISETEIIIGVPNAFTQEWLENKYHPQIQTVLKKIHPTTINVKYQIVSSPALKPEPRMENIATPPKISESSPANATYQLNTHYSFENFIIGNSNRLAAATAQAVAQSPGTVYNPLFIYGGVGLGKTHLVQAIGNEIHAKSPKKKIVYVSCEKFTNDYISSITSKKTNDFKKTYRDADVLMVDDIQFMAGKEGTQEEFFHTFNALHQANRQIIITSDRVPKAIPQLADRLSSRFGWGMVADIQTPNLEMRQAILQSKCAERNLVLNDDVVRYIAENIESNIRELEGAINRITSFADLTNQTITLELTTKALEDMVQSKAKNLSVEKVIKAALTFFDISLDDIMSGKRNRELVRPRQIIMYLLRHEMNLSYPKIGVHLNKKDHTTIIYGVEKIEKEIARNEELGREIATLKEKIHAYWAVECRK